MTHILQPHELSRITHMFVTNLDDPPKGVHVRAWLDSGFRQIVDIPVADSDPLKKEDRAMALIEDTTNRVNKVINLIHVVL